MLFGVCKLKSGNGCFSSFRVDMLKECILFYNDATILFFKDANIAAVI